MKLRTLAALAALAALLLPAPPAPAAPPPDTVRAWVIEWAGGAAPAVQSGEVTYTGVRDRSLLVVVPFDVRGRRRQLIAHRASFAGPVGPDTYYPAVWVDGHGDLVPACPADAACANPWKALPEEPRTLPVGGNSWSKSSFYVIAQNLDLLKITTSPGWKPPRELRDRLTVRLVRKTGTGSIVLKGGDPVLPGYEHWRTARCDDPVAFGAAIRTTTWQVEGDVTGYTTIPDRLAVVDLPRFP